jgi:hypothetical protein
MPKVAVTRGRAIRRERNDADIERGRAFHVRAL